MTALNAGAPSDETLHWSSIDWPECYRAVRRLQSRIVKAQQAGRWNKVKALQWLLTHSFAGKALAVKRVTENSGKNTPGVDRVRWSTPEAKFQAILSLKRRGYRPLPLKRVYIPKSSDPTQKRPLGIPVMRCRAQQALHLLALEPVAEILADAHAYGFRPQRSTADAIEQCFKLLAFKRSPQYILEGDIKSCFDKISHSWLVANVPTDKVMLQKWLKAGYIDNHQRFPTEAGTPQGGIISPTAAMLTLSGMQGMLEAAFPRTTVAGKRAKVNLVTYADDFVITGSSKELLENEVKPRVEAFLAERGLALSPQKTRITDVEDGFDFLGQHVRKYGEKLLIKPSKRNVTAFLNKVRAIVQGNKQAKQVNLIRQLNPVITGWANYHRHVVAKAVFTKVDHEIWRMLWQWALRRHPEKSRYWIKDRYFPDLGSRRWVFNAPTDDRSQRLALVQAADTPIRRHRKIKSAANPFDPAWETYFEERHSFRMWDSLRGRRQIARLWLDQNELCPVCRQRITVETPWTVHHLVPRSAGGPDAVTNQVMLHRHCHQLVHETGISVVKPAPIRGL
jgi:RNA-directed DNA polymerase